MKLIVDKIVDKKILGELFLAVGGFVLADTLVRKFLELPNNVIPWWILPLISVLIIIVGVELRENKAKWQYIILASLLIISIIFLILSSDKIVNAWWLFASLILWFIWGIIVLFFPNN